MYRKGILPLLFIYTVWSWECPTDHIYLDVPQNALLQGSASVHQMNRNDEWEGIRLHIELLDSQLTDSLQQELNSKLIPYIQDWYSQILMVKRLTQNLVISEDTCNYGIPHYHRTLGVPADLLVYIQSNSEENQTWTARAKICQIQDGDLQMPLAGMFEINTFQYISLTYQEKQALLIHELAHILGLPNLLHDKHPKSTFLQRTREEVGTSQPFLLRLFNGSTQGIQEFQSECEENYEFSKTERRCVVIQCDKSCKECDRYDAKKCKNGKECRDYLNEKDFKAYLTESLDELYIDLMRDIDIQRGIDCSEIFIDQYLEKLGSGSRCEVMRNNKIHVVLGNDASFVDMTLGLNPDILFTNTGECTDKPSHILIPLSVPDSLPKPQAVITAPITFSTVCGDEKLIISGSESTDGLNRNLFYSWELKQNDNSDLPSFSNFSKNQITISIPIEKLTGSVLEVQLWLKNDFGGIDTCTQTIQILQSPAPSIMISIPKSTQLTEVKPLVLNYCGIQSELEFSWKLIDINGDTTSYQPDSTYSLQITWKLGSSSGSTSLPIKSLPDETQLNQESTGLDVSDTLKWSYGSAIFSQSIYSEDDDDDECHTFLGPVWVMIAWTVFMLLLALSAFLATHTRKKDKEVYSPIPPGTERRERELEVHEQGDHRIVEVIERDRRVVDEHWIFGMKFWQYHLTFGVCNRYDRHPALRLLTLTTIIMVEFCIFGILYYEIGDSEFEGDDEDAVFEDYGDDIGYIFSAVGITFSYLLLMMTLLAIFDHIKKGVLPTVIGLLLTLPLLAAAIVGISILDAEEFCGRAEREWSLSIIWIFLIEVLIMESLVALLFTLFSCCRNKGKRRRAKREEKRRSQEAARV